MENAILFLFLVPNDIVQVTFFYYSTVYFNIPYKHNIKNIIFGWTFNMSISLNNSVMEVLAFKL